MIYNSKGMSLVELMVVLGITSIVATGTASMISNQNRAIQSIKQKAELTNLMGDLKLIFSEPKLCAASLVKVRLAPTEKGLNTYCYDGVDPTFNQDSGGVVKAINGKKVYGNLMLKKFCVTWKSTLDTVNDPTNKNPPPEPKSIRGLASLVFQGEREMGGSMMEQSMLLKMTIEKAPDSDRFNIKNIGENFDRAEPVVDHGIPSDLSKVRPVKAAYVVKACTSSGDIPTTPDTTPTETDGENGRCYRLNTGDGPARGSTICVDKIGLFYNNAFRTGDRVLKLFSGNFSNGCLVGFHSITCFGLDGLVYFYEKNGTLYGAHTYKKPIKHCSTGVCYTQSRSMLPMGGLPPYFGVTEGIMCQIWSSSNIPVCAPPLNVDMKSQELPLPADGP